MNIELPPTPRDRKPFTYRPFPLETIPTEPEMVLPITFNKQSSGVKDKIKFFEGQAKKNNYPVLIPPEPLPDFKGLTVAVPERNREISYVPLAINCNKLMKHKFFKCKKLTCDNFTELLVVRYSLLFSYIKKNKLKNTIDIMFKNLSSEGKNISKKLPDGIENNKGINTIIDILKKGNKEDIITSTITYKTEAGEFNYSDLISMFTEKYKSFSSPNTYIPFVIKVNNAHYAEIFDEDYFSPYIVMDEILEYANIAIKNKNRKSNAILDFLIFEIYANNALIMKIPIFTCEDMFLSANFDGAYILDYDRLQELTDRLPKTHKRFNLIISGIIIVEN